MTNRKYESVQSYLFNNRNNKIDAHQFFERVDTAEAQIIKDNIYDNTVLLNRDVFLNILKFANDVFDNKAYMYVDDSEVSRYYNAVVKMKRLVINVRDPSLRQSLYNTIAYIERLLNIGTVNDSEITMLIADFYDLYSNYNIELPPPPPQALPRSRRPSVVQPAAPAPVPTIVREQTKPEQIIIPAAPPPPSSVPNIPAPPPPPPPPPPPSSMSELPPAPPMPTKPQPAAPLDDRQQLLEAIRNEKNRTRLRPVKPKTVPETNTIIEVPTTVLPKEPKPPSASPPPPPPPPAPPAPPPMIDLSSAPLQPPLVDLPAEMLPPPAPSLSNVLSELKSGTVRLKPAQKRPQSEIIPKSSTTKNLIADVLVDTINRRRVAMAKSSSEATSNDEGWDDGGNNRPNAPDVKYVQALFNVFTSSQLYTNDSDEKNTKAHNILNDVESLLQNKTQTNIDKARLLLQDLASRVVLSENPLDSPAIGLQKQPLFETNRNLFYKSIEDLIFKFRYKDAENHLIFALTYHPKDYKFNELLKYVQQLSVNQQRTESNA
nr:orf1629 [Bombyx mori nucleopolyhedrovirus]